MVDGTPTRYTWEDKRKNGNWSSCSHYGYFFPEDAFLMYDSIVRVMNAMDDPDIYDRCFVFQDPGSGETVYSIHYDDPGDPSGSTVRRVLTITVAPNATCN